MKHQSGAALAETVVLMLVLMPIMFGVPMIGKLIDLRQTTVQASRYAAWEGTVGDAKVAPRDVKARFFSDPMVALGGDASAPNLLWGGGTSSEEAADAPNMPEVESQTLKNYWSAAHTVVELDENTGGAIPYSSAYNSGAEGKFALNIEELVNGIAETTADLTGGSWMDKNSQTKGMLRADVRADVKENGWFGPLIFSDATVIMHDNWSAGNDDMAADRARAMVPAGVLRTIGSTISKFGNFPLFKELKGMDESFGYVDMRPLPDSEIRQRVLKDYEED